MKKSINLLESLGLWRYWVFKSNLNFRLRYRGTSLGIFWPALSVTMVVAVLGTLWGVLLEKTNLAAYYFYLLAGYSIWTVISAVVEQGARAVESRLAGGVPFFTVILERLTLAFLPFLFTLPIIVISSLLMFEEGLGLALYGVLTVGLLVIWSTGSICILITIVSLAPDLRHLINAMMRLAFLATPIIWTVDRLGKYQKYIWINPFYIPLESCRNALHGAVDGSLIIVFVAYALGTFVIGVIALKIRLPELSR